MANIKFFPYDRMNTLAIWNHRHPINTMLVPANTVGDVQQGIMSQVAKHHPEMMARYVRMCLSGEVVLGKVVVMRPNPNPNKIQYFFLPLRTVSNDPPSNEALVDGLRDVVRLAKKYHVSGIASMKLGCGSNPDFHIAWSFAGAAMVHYLNMLSCPVAIHIGTSDPIPQAPISTVSVQLDVPPVVVEKAPAPIVAKRSTIAEQIAALIRSRPVKSSDGTDLTDEEREELIISLNDGIV